jgi:hypothetical protein
MILPPFPEGLTRRNLSSLVAIDTSIIGRSFTALDVAPRGVLVGAADPPAVGATERLRISLKNGTAIVNVESRCVSVQRDTAAREQAAYLVALAFAQPLAGEAAWSLFRIINEVSSAPVT